MADHPSRFHRGRVATHVAATYVADSLQNWEGFFDLSLLPSSRFKHASDLETAVARATALAFSRVDSAERFATIYARVLGEARFLHVQRPSAHTLASKSEHASSEASLLRWFFLQLPDHDRQSAQCSDTWVVAAFNRKPPAMRSEEKFLTRSG